MKSILSKSLKPAAVIAAVMAIIITLAFICPAHAEETVAATATAQTAVTAAKSDKPKKVKGVTLSSSAEGQLVVKWNKRKCSGYQIQIATDKNFKKIVKTKKVKKTKTSVTFTLKKKKKDYVRLRYYKGSQYSKWCATKNKKTK